MRWIDDINSADAAPVYCRIDINERSKNIKALILLFSDLDTIALQKGDVLGDAYEYLIFK